MSFDTIDLSLLRAPYDASVMHRVEPPRAIPEELRSLPARIADALRGATLASDRGTRRAGTGYDPSRDAVVEQPTLDWLGTSGGVRYPVVAGIPLLTADYAFDQAGSLGLSTGITVAEQEHYTAESLEQAANPASSAAMRTLAGAVQAARVRGPLDPARWVDAPYDGPAQLRCYSHLAPRLPGGTALQVGGVGTHALKFLLAGAPRAVAVSPVVGELVLAIACARYLGLTDRLHLVAGTGEALPLADGSIDALYCGGTLHHMDTALAGREFRRVLAPDGRFAGAEPWRVPVLHATGTRLLGKREPVDCRPLDEARLAGLRRGFGGSVRDRRHGAFTRYPALALGKVGVHPRTSMLLRLMLREDGLELPFSSLGSSVSIIGAR